MVASGRQIHLRTQLNQAVIGAMSQFQISRIALSNSQKLKKRRSFRPKTPCLKILQGDLEKKTCHHLNLTPYKKQSTTTSTNAFPATHKSYSKSTLIKIGTTSTTTQTPQKPLNLSWKNQSIFKKTPHISKSPPNLSLNLFKTVKRNFMKILKLLQEILLGIKLIATFKRVRKKTGNSKSLLTLLIIFNKMQSLIKMCKEGEVYCKRFIYFD